MSPQTKLSIRLEQSTIEALYNLADAMGMNTTNLPPATVLRRVFEDLIPNLLLKAKELPILNETTLVPVFSPPFSPTQPMPHRSSFASTRKADALDLMEVDSALLPYIEQAERSINNEVNTLDLTINPTDMLQPQLPIISHEPPWTMTPMVSDIDAKLLAPDLYAACKDDPLRLYSLRIVLHSSPDLGRDAPRLLLLTYDSLLAWQRDNLQKGVHVSNSPQPSIPNYYKENV